MELGNSVSFKPENALKRAQNPYLYLMSQLDSLHTLTTYFFQINIIIILSSTPPCLLSGLLT